MSRIGSRIVLFGCWWMASLLSGCVLVTGHFSLFGSQPGEMQERVVSGEGKSKIVIIEVAGLISNADERGPLGFGARPGTTAMVREQLDRAAEDEQVKAVLLRINSPGGTVTASDMIYRDVMDFKARRSIPVLAQMLDLATSGGYYVALASDEIVASPTTVTGSVGVILSGVNLSGLMDKIGVTNQTLKTGVHKDSGSPLRPMTAADEALLQGVLADLQSRFVATVRERRPQLSASAMTTISDGRIVSAPQALALGLVDRIGYLDDTIRHLESRPDIGPARVVLYRRPQELAENIYSQAPLRAPQMNLINIDLQHLGFGTPQFLYLWSPQP